MDQRLFIILFCSIFFLETQVSYAGPILYRVQEKKMMEQREQQMEIQEMMQVHHQTGVVVQEQEQAPTYQQVVDHRNQAIAQAILNAHTSSGNLIVTNAVEKPASPSFFQWIMSILRYLFAPLKHFIDWLIGLIWYKAPVDQEEQPVFSSVVDQQVTDSSSASPADVNNATLQPPLAAAPAGPADDQDVVDLSEVWKKLDKKSTVWQLLADDQSKILTVSEYIGRFKKEGVKIKQPASYYVQLIDQMAEGNPQMLQRPFGELLQIIAIVDYDFDNGMDKDDLAKRVLGEAGYESNKQRLIQRQQQQEQQQQQQQQQQ